MANRKTKDISKDFDVNAAQQMIESQHKTINELCKLNEEYKEKITHLEKLLTENVSITTLDPAQLKPEEIIAETQLNLLKQASFNRALTLEETKRVEIFHKILQARYKTPVKDKEVTAMSVDELMKLVSDENEKSH